MIMIVFFQQLKYDTGRFSGDLFVQWKCEKQNLQSQVIFVNGESDLRI